MYKNIGGKLKGAAKTAFPIGIMFSLLGGYCLIATLSYFALAVVALGIVLSWLTALALYGLGELVDCARRIADEQQMPSEGIVPPPHAGWTCSNCGTQNLLGDAVCKNCGKS